MKIDWKKLKTAIHEDTKLIRSLKAQGFHGGSLATEKHRATMHHAIAAHARGHVHLSSKFLCNPRWISETWGPCFVKEGMSLEEQAFFIKPVLSSFLVQEVPEVAETKTA